MINQYQDGPDTSYVGGLPVLEYYDLQWGSRWVFLVYETLFFVVFLFGCYLALAFIRHGAR